MITSKGIKIVASFEKNPKELIILDIQHSEIVRVVTDFTKLVFLYTKPSCANYICERLQMTENSSDKCK